jgi:hypothetical protein
VAKVKLILDLPGFDPTCFASQVLDATIKNSNLNILRYIFVGSPAVVVLFTFLDLKVEVPQKKVRQYILDYTNRLQLLPVLLDMYHGNPAEFLRLTTYPTYYGYQVLAVLKKHPKFNLTEEIQKEIKADPALFYKSQLF